MDKKNAASISSSETFTKRRAIFLSVRKTVNPRILRVTWGDQNSRKLLSTDLVNTKYFYFFFFDYSVQLLQVGDILRIQPSD